MYSLIGLSNYLFTWRYFEKNSQNSFWFIVYLYFQLDRYIKIFQEPYYYTYNVDHICLLYIYIFFFNIILRNKKI